ncbi:MAG: SIR2 family protein [Pseudazoarcus pumilus]|nr:SIR2 family protein [Pseudazoarcus pumilus]
MSRSLLIFGNGMGLALDPEYFSLGNGLTSVWNDTDHLSKEHKSLILSAIKGTTEETPPCSEDQLDQLQVAIVATEFLCNFEVGGTSWVSPPAKQLPSAFKKYIHEVALHFHRSNSELPNEFLEPLSDYIKSTKSHVVTLNYDNLLYDGFKSKGVLDGYNGPLIDGFWASTGFDEEHLDRRNIKRHGWYMHLHGSPLFIGNNKVMRAGRDFLDPEEESHIVLAHVKHKPLIIGSSHILSSYWRRLEKAFEESDQVVLFGYSGLDEHLNERIKLRKEEKELLVVEWDGSGEERDRRRYWEEKVGFPRFDLVRLESILDFTAW